LNNPVTEGRDLIGRAASVFEAYFKGGVSFACLSGLGVLDLCTRGVLDNTALVAEVRMEELCGVFTAGVLRDLTLTRPRDGVPSMVERGFR
jgi:hypothetical protein